MGARPNGAPCSGVAPPSPPCTRLGFQDYSEIARRPSDEEVDGLFSYARSLGLWRFEEAPRFEAGASPGAGEDALAG